MTELRRVPANDHMWLMAALDDALKGGPALQPIESDDTPAPGQLPEGTALVIHTSGSSGTPKFVAHTSASIRAGAEATNAILGGAGQWLVALPTHLIAGLQVLSRSVLAGTTPLFLAGKFSPKKFIELATKLDAPRRYTSLVPMQLASLLEYAEEHPDALPVLRRFDAILVGGQSLSLSLRAFAHTHKLAVVRTYGMTETGGGVVYDGVEIGDTGVRIRDGEVQLSGSSLAIGYIGDEALTAQHFITENGVRWYRTGDAGTLLGGMLQVTGRLDRVIISGGVNVSVDTVQMFVQEQPGWEQAVAVAVTDARWGERIALAVEAEHLNPEAAFSALAEQVKNVLGPAAQPASVTVLDTLPRLANTKIDYQQLTALLQKDQT